jgi:hypothetical protein
MSGPDKKKWKEAMQSEIDSLPENNTWKIMPLPKGKQNITSKWIYKVKYNSDHSVDVFKARLVARGFSQKPGIDFEETFAPVARGVSVRTILAITANRDWEMIQFDVRTAFLYGDLDEEIYMQLPEGIMFDRSSMHQGELTSSSSMPQKPK